MHHEEYVFLQLCTAKLGTQEVLTSISLREDPSRPTLAPCRRTEILWYEVMSSMTRRGSST